MLFEAENIVFPQIFMKDSEFLSYWTLVRKEENPIVFGDYKIFKVKHY